MKLFTIGFTQRSAEEFFTCLKQAGVRRVIDIRLNNTSQLSGFAKARDLRYFLHAVAGIAYLAMPDFAPTPEILDDFKKKKGAWETYMGQFNALMKERHIEDIAAATLQDGDCFLCSEPTPEYCHRRLAAEYLQERLGNLEIVHL